MEKNLQKATRCIRLICFFSLVFYLPSSAQNADISMLRSIYGGRHASFKTGSEIVSATAYPISIAAPIAVYGYGAVSHKKEYMIEGLEMATGLAVTIGTSYLLKTIVHRDRPYETYSDVKPFENDDSYSFPSAHTAATFATATSLSLQFKKWYVVVPSFLYAGAVGYCRMYEGMHYPTDVLAGALIGTGSAYLSYRLELFFKNKWQHKFTATTF